MGVAWAQAQAFSDAQKDQVRVVAQLAADALGRARLLEAERTARQRTERLQQTMTALVASASLAEVTAAVFQHGLPPFGASAARLALADQQEPGLLLTLSAVGLPESVLAGWQALPATTPSKLEIAVRRFGEWLAGHDPQIVSYADVTRDHCLGWAESLAEAPAEKTGKPLGAVTRIQRISGLSQMFRDTAAWEYADVPGYAPITSRDAPKLPQRIPRFIPDHELDLVMPVINEITCPFQRAALLVARWSGARRDEIRHLPLDCLDHYPDGTPRLRLPGRKTYKERMVPLHQDAGDALQKVIDLRKDGPERPFTDERTGEQVRYLFMDHGKLLSLFYLFNTPIQQACEQTGLVVPGGKKGGSGVRGTISAHRFRHTVGTQLAERGAKLHTIMKVLGHSSVSMALVYAQISDREVLRDYKSILAPGAVIAGPAALDLKSGVLPDEAVHWLKTNFFKTELELGHCLRLPAEGPCECDLYLTCAKFVTTGEYAPRLRARLEVEQQLVQDAHEHGWAREAERHTAIARRLTGLLTDLGEITDHHTPETGPRPCTSTD